MSHWWTEADGREEADWIEARCAASGLIRDGGDGLEEVPVSLFCM